MRRLILVLPVLAMLALGVGCSTVVTTHAPESESFVQPSRTMQLDASTETIEVFAATPR